MKTFENSRPLRHFVTFAATLLATCHAAVSFAATLTLDAALERVIAAHPDLKSFDLRAEAAKTEVALADLPPAITLGVAIENAAGSGAFKAWDSAESTLTLAGVLERGGKRAARRAIAEARFDALGLQRAALQMDVLAETAHRYLDVIACRERIGLLSDEIAQRERMVIAARQRFSMGAAPEAMALRAEADVAATRADISAATSRCEVLGQRLALLWSGEWESGTKVTSLPNDLPTLPEFSTLKKLLANNPDLVSFADEARVRDARVRLAAAGRMADLEWEFGLRHFADTGDVGLVGSARLPIGAARRGRLEETIATTERAALQNERQSVEAQLEATLLEAWAQGMAAERRAAAIDAEILPRLRKAAENAERAYTAGALTYVEWADIQSSVSSVLGEAVAARLEWRRAMIQIQRLTAEPIVSVRSKE